MSFLLDTGMSGSVTLAKEDFKRLESRGLITSLRTAQISTLSGDLQRKSGRLRSLGIGPFEHTSLIADEAPSNKIGLGYLSRFRVTIDVPRQRLYLARGNSYAKTDDNDTSGLHMLSTNKRVVVEVVDDHSPAQRAGIIKGDIVLDVNGIPMTGATLSGLRRTFRGNKGQKHRVTILRGEQKFTVSFSLQDFADWNRFDGDSEKQ